MANKRVLAKEEKRDISSDINIDDQQNKNFAIHNIFRAQPMGYKRFDKGIQ